MRIYSLVWWTVCGIVALIVAGNVHARTPGDVDTSSKGLHSSDSDRFFAVIDWSSGAETLDLRIDLDPTYGAGWVVAIPAASADVTASWCDKFPQYSGRTPESKLHGELAFIITASRATQLYPILLDELLFAPSLGWSAEVVPVPGLSETRAGLVYSIISPENVADLEHQVANAGIALSPIELGRIAAYLDRKHCFLLIAMKSARAYSSAVAHNPNRAADVPCLEIQFPSNEPVLPMHVANGAGSYARENVWITGYVDLATELPQVGNLAAGRLRYFRGVNQNSDRRGKMPTVAYSRWECRSQDLEVHFTPETGAVFQRRDHNFARICSPGVLFGIFLLWTGLCSYFSGGVAGILAEGRWRSFRGVGLWNFGTILALRARLGKTMWVEGGMTKTRRRIFLVAFTLIFIGLNHVASALLYAYLGSFTAGW